mgnify:CR=1 FL=1
MPTRELLAEYKLGEMTNKAYAIKYLKQIKDIDFNMFYRSYDESVLLCYEKNEYEKDWFCHRKVLCWRMQQLGFPIREL